MADQPPQADRLRVGNGLEAMTDMGPLNNAQVREDVEHLLADALHRGAVLVADEGLLWLANEMKKAGELPADLVLKISVLMGAANPLAIRCLEQMGAGTYNTPTDLSLPQLAAIRQVARGEVVLTG